MPYKSYDKVGYNEDILLDLPYREMVGVLTHDHATPHHILVQHDPGGGSFAWDSLASGQPVLEFTAVGGGNLDGVYMDCSAADTADLDFTNDDFSIGCWINWDSGGGWSELILGRYGVDFDGWEIYLDISGGRNTVTQRHHHSSIGGNTNSSCFSTGWTPGTWALLGVSRIGGNLYPVHHRNGVALTMSYEASGMLDPDACNRDLVIGSRFTKDANWYRGLMSRPRVWGRALTASEWLDIYNDEKAQYGL